MKKRTLEKEPSSDFARKALALLMADLNAGEPTSNHTKIDAKQRAAFLQLLTEAQRIIFRNICLRKVEEVTQLHIKRIQEK